MIIKDIFNEAKSCVQCYPGQEICVPLPDPKNSDGKADIMFVLERPGRNGAGKSGVISFDNGDPAANFFRDCFEYAGLNRKNVFITNACLCYPTYDGYRDKPPTTTELMNCHSWLRQQLKLVEPKLIITVGQRAFESAIRCFEKWPYPGCKQFVDLVVGNLIKETDPWVYPLSHTSRRGRANRSAKLQRMDWKKIPEILIERHKI